MNNLSDLPHILLYHAEGACGLSALRNRLLTNPDAKLANLVKLDDRLTAYLDGLLTAATESAAAAVAAIIGVDAERKSLEELNE